eukprot:2051589-Pleurochrysis_carterae.AAC.1
MALLILCLFHCIYAAACGFGIKIARLQQVLVTPRGADARGANHVMMHDGTQVKFDDLKSNELPHAPIRSSAVNTRTD